MKPATVDIEFTRGDSYSLFARARDRVWNPTTEEYEPGAYKDLTDWTARAQVRTTKDAVSVLWAFTVTFGNQTTTPGSLWIKAVPTDTEGIAITGDSLEVPWDLEFTTDVGEVYTYAQGTVKLNKDVSRD